MSAVGERVGAVLSIEGKVLKLLGYGVYRGDEVPPATAGGMGALLNEIGMVNPAILLDSGKVVYGCECWWGAENALKEKIINDGLTVINVDIEEARANA